MINNDNMADLNRSLKDYLSKSQSAEPLLGSEASEKGSFSFGRLNPFRKPATEEHSDDKDVTNAWFSQAQKDPFCPSLVSEWTCLLFLL